VYNGLVAAMADVQADDWVLVHDAARPCLPPADLSRLYEECRNDEIGGILALPVADTVKRAGKDETGAQRISGTEDRGQLWLAQTPQMFRAGLLAQALRSAKGTITDEASAVEQMGLRPRLVPGSRENLKVTWPEDLAIAQSILSRR
jgi:2-C-methyl-D-erythritol 4-phosphate cytidylyltransferase